MKPDLKFPKAAVWPTVILIILLLVWLWWGLARLLSDGWIDHKIAELRYGGRPLKHDSTPAIRDLSSLRIVVQRDCADQPCPDGFRAEIQGDGMVRYLGGPDLAISGEHQAHLTEAQLRGLHQAFVAANFFWLRPRYQGPRLAGAGAMQPPVWRISLAYDGRPARQVEAFNPDVIGMPKAVQILEQALYRQAGLKRWVEGDETTIASLEAEGWDLKADTPQNGALIVGSAKAANAGLVRNLIAAGAPIHGVYGCRALSAAAFGRRYKPIYQMLAEAGAPTRSGDCAVPEKWPGLG